MLNQTQIARAWGPACTGGRANVTLHGGGIVTVRGSIVDATRAMNSLLQRYNYRTIRSQTGAYNCRQKVGGGGWSNHSFATAIDINWNLNPYGGNRHHIPAALARDICRIRTNNGRQVWNWGGYWRGTRDWMHFEIVCTPRDIATGINWRTVAGGAVQAPRPAAPAGPPPNLAAIAQGIAQAKTQVLRQGSRGDAVKFLQQGLNNVSNRGLQVNGIFGGGTDAAVKDLQRFVGLHPNGIVGPQTWNIIYPNIPPARPVDLVALNNAIVNASRQVLRQGSRGGAVTILQSLLNAKGVGPLATDGNFGPATRNAVIRFQRNTRAFLNLGNHMAIDGVVGPVTWYWLTR